MVVPKFLQYDGGKVKINPTFFEFSQHTRWSPERAIEILWQTAYDVLYHTDVQAGKITQEFAEKKLQALNHAYAGVKHKFQDIERNNGGRYFDHQLRVAYNILTKSKKPSLRKVLIALHHDSIEDTDYDFDTLETTLNAKIALGVEAISKRPFTEFARMSTGQIMVYLSQEKKEEIKQSGVMALDGGTLSDIYLEKKYLFPDEITPQEQICEKMWRDSLSDIEKYNVIEASGILNRKGLLSDKYISKKNFKPEKIKFRERFAEELYRELHKKYKYLRNDEYFSHMVASDLEKGTMYVYEQKLQKYPSLNKFYAHAIRLIQKHRIHFDEDILLGVVLDSIEVKFWDRIDNLETTELYQEFTSENVKKAQRKITETECYFYQISKEYDMIAGTDFYPRIVGEVQRLKEYILSYEKNSIQSQVQEIIEK